MCSLTQSRGATHKGPLRHQFLIECHWVITAGNVRELFPGSQSGAIRLPASENQFLVSWTTAFPQYICSRLDVWDVLLSSSNSSEMMLCGGNLGRIRDWNGYFQPRYYLDMPESGCALKNKVAFPSKHGDLVLNEAYTNYIVPEPYYFKKANYQIFG